MKTKIKIEIPAPQAYSIRLKYGIALNTAIMLSGKVHVISATDSGELTPTKKPFKKLKSHCRGVKSRVNKDAMFDKTYRRTLKKSKAICAKSSMPILVSPYRGNYCVKHNQSYSNTDYNSQKRCKVCYQTCCVCKHGVCHIGSPVDKHNYEVPRIGPASLRTRSRSLLVFRN